ncbi:MAG: hypothetical protein ACUVV0_05845 [Anaerolineae bacterium]
MAVISMFYGTLFIYENDIATLMHYYRPAIATLIEKLKRYLGEVDIAKLQGIVKEIEQRLERFRRGKR